MREVNEAIMLNKIFTYLFGSDSDIKYVKAADEYLKNKITAREFSKKVNDVSFYYTTPFIEKSNGMSELCALAPKGSEDKYFPAFLTKQKCVDFTRSLGGENFIVIEGSLDALVSGLYEADENMLGLKGIVIEPMKKYPVVLHTGKGELL